LGDRKGKQPVLVLHKGFLPEQVQQEIQWYVAKPGSPGKSGVRNREEEVFCGASNSS